MTLLDFVP